jgi:sterol desaturase/sphingolipid hydroxylase (fatty acid hydroxylase superfamily)
MLYVLSYEWLHLAYHLPQDTVLGRNPLVRVLARHHARHHDPRLMQKWNFNVTVPLWDWVRGTIWRPPSPVASGEQTGSTPLHM